MSRFEGLVSAVLLVLATFFVTEWVHYRLDAPPIFQALLGSNGESDGSGTVKNPAPDNVTESEFQTYLRVLEAMQADRTLSIEGAVEAEHVPLTKFREIEQRVQRNEVLIDRARTILRERAESLWNAHAGLRDHG